MNTTAPLEKVLQAFPDAKKRGKEWIARCPAHEDTNPSLNFREANDGKILLTCRAGCSRAAIVRAAGLVFRDLRPVDPSKNGNGIASRRPVAKSATKNAKPKKTHPTLEAAIDAAKFSVGNSCTIAGQWTYENADGSECFRVVRFNIDGSDAKEFRPIHTVRGGWAIGDPPGKLPLYRLCDIADVEIIVEGEKCCDAANEIGLRATTSAHGSQSPNKTDWTPLRGRAIYILPDNDPAGAKYGNAVAAILKSLDCTVKIVELPGLSNGEDVVDFIALRRDAGLSDDAIREEIEALCEAAEEYTPEPMQVESEGEQPQDGEPGFHFTELGNAKLLVDKHGPDLIYPPSLGWHFWNGKRYLFDEGEIGVRRMAETTIRGMYATVSTIQNDELRKRLREHAKASENRTRITNMIYLAQADARVTVSTDALDADPWLLNVQNGTVDLRTADIRPHDRADRITKICNVSYSFTAGCPLWEASLTKWTNGDVDMIDHMGRFAGYAATGVIREHVLPVLYGLGANGKTVFLNTLQWVLGDYAMTAAPQFLMYDPHGRHPTERADLRGMRFVSTIESSEGGRLDEAKVKELTGRDRIRARRMRQDFFEFEPSHKICIATNHKPDIRGNDDGIWRRIRLWPFTVQIPPADQDPALFDKLKAEGPAILSWIVRGCLRWQRDGLREPQSVLAATKEYREESDLLGRFIEQHCEVDENFWVGATDLHKRFCETYGDRVLSMKRFGKRLGELGYRDDRAASGHVIRRGLRLLCAEPSEGSSR